MVVDEQRISAGDRVNVPLEDEFSEQAHVVQVPIGPCTQAQPGNDGVLVSQRII